MSKIFSGYRGVILIPIFLILILFLMYNLYEAYFGFSVTAKFKESGPLFINMPVYYKGYNIGEVKKIHPSKDYKYTLVKIVFFPREPKLPEDVSAEVKHHNVRKEYIDLIGLDPSTTALLKNRSTISGEPAFDIEDFLSDIADSGLIVPLLQTFTDTLVSIGKTSTETKNFFSELRSTLKDNRNDLKLTTKSMANVSSRLNKSLTDEKLKNTTSNINKSSTNILTVTENVKVISENINSATENIDKTVERLDATLCEAHATAANAHKITSGLREVLSQRFAGLKIIFGKPMKCK